MLYRWQTVFFRLRDSTCIASKSVESSFECVLFSRHSRNLPVNNDIFFCRKRMWTQIKQLMSTCRAVCPVHVHGLFRYISHVCSPLCLFYRPFFGRQNWHLCASQAPAGAEQLQRLLCGFCASPSRFRDTLILFCLSSIQVGLISLHITKDIEWGHISDVVEDDQGPVGRPPPAAVCSNCLVQTVHASFVALVIQDHGWLPVFPTTKVSRCVECTQEDHIPILLWDNAIKTCQKLFQLELCMDTVMENVLVFL